MYILIAALSSEVAELAESEKDHLVISGIGKLNGMLALSERCQKSEHPISCVINLGTAGSHCLDGGQLVEITKCFQRDTAFFSDSISLSAITELPSVGCGSSDRVEPSSEHDPWSVVDMELYSLALFCRQRGIPLVSIKYVTDRNDVNVYKEWKKKLPAASLALSRFWMDHKEHLLSRLCPK